MPSDEIVQEPNYVTTRAVTINAPPEAVWPWLAQMGESPRGGFYSYEWIERLLGMKIQNADSILADYQDTRKGDVLDRRGTMVVLDIDPGHWIALGPPPGDPSLWLTSSWTLALYPAEGDSTRLVSRVRAQIRRRPLGTLTLMALMDPGQLLMELKMFSEIKKRAESGNPIASPA